MILHFSFFTRFDIFYFWGSAAWGEAFKFLPNITNINFDKCLNATSFYVDFESEVRLDWNLQNQLLHFFYIWQKYISQRRPRKMPRLRNVLFRNYIFGGGLYMTLGPKFNIFSVFSPRICFCFVKQYCIAGIAAFVEILLLAVSKHVLKRS